jgi:hypothetical protein
MQRRLAKLQYQQGRPHKLGFPVPKPMAPSTIKEASNDLAEVERRTGSGTAVLVDCIEELASGRATRTICLTERTPAAMCIMTKAVRSGID